MIFGKISLGALLFLFCDHQVTAWTAKHHSTLTTSQTTVGPRAFSSSTQALSRTPSLLLSTPSDDNDGKKDGDIAAEAQAALKEAEDAMNFETPPPPPPPSTPIPGSGISPELLGDAFVTAVGSSTLGIIAGLGLDVSVGVSDPLVPPVLLGVLFGGSSFGVAASEELGGGLRSTIGTATKAVGKAIGRLLKRQVDNVVDEVTAIPTNIKKGVEQKIDDTVEDIKAIPGKVKDEVVAIPGKVQEAATQAAIDAAEEIKATPGRLAESTKQAAIGAAEEIKATPGRLAESTKQALVETVTTVETVIEDKIEETKTGITTAVDEVVALPEKTLTKISESVPFPEKEPEPPKIPPPPPVEESVFPKVTIPKIPKPPSAVPSPPKADPPKPKSKPEIKVPKISIPKAEKITPPKITIPKLPSPPPVIPSPPKVDPPKAKAKPAIKVPKISIPKPPSSPPPAKKVSEQERAQAAKDALEQMRKAAPGATVSLFGIGLPGLGSDTERDEDDDEIPSNAPRGVPIISKWNSNKDGSITGIVRRSRSYEDGEAITTSPLRSDPSENILVQTQSGSKYFLANQAKAGRGILDLFRARQATPAERKKAEAAKLAAQQEVAEKRRQKAEQDRLEKLEKARLKKEKAEAAAEKRSAREAEIQAAKEAKEAAAAEAKLQREAAAAAKAAVTAKAREQKDAAERALAQKEAEAEAKRAASQRAAEAAAQKAAEDKARREEAAAAKRAVDEEARQRKEAEAEARRAAAEQARLEKAAAAEQARQARAAEAAAKKAAAEEARRQRAEEAAARKAAAEEARAQKRAEAAAKKQAAAEARKQADEARKADAEARRSKAARAAQQATSRAPIGATISLFGFGDPDSENSPPPSRPLVKAPRGVPTIVNWRKRRDGGITGNVYDSPSFSDGERIDTSKVASGTFENNNVVTTVSGSRYFLVGTKPVKEPTKGVPVLSRWRKNGDGSVTGFISGSKSFKDGEKVTTSPIKKGSIAKGETVRTGSGSSYFLS